MQREMLQMKTVNKGQVHVLTTPYGPNWTCFAEGEIDDTAFKITGTGDTPSAAVEQAYARWLKITRQVPEFLTGLPAPEDHIDVDGMIVKDDDIPF